MSQPCSIAECERRSLAVCHCCKQNLCRSHLILHDDLLNSQLNPLTDQVNQVHERLNNINEDDMLSLSSEQLELWRQQSYQIIDAYVNEKLCLIKKNIHSKSSNISQRIEELKTLIEKRMKTQDATIDDLNYITSSIRIIQLDLTQLKYKSNDLNMRRLTLDDDLIELDNKNIKPDFNLSNLAPPEHVISRPAENSKALATDNNVLLIYYNDQLCLLDQNLTIIRSIPWANTWIWDMCWSSTLSRFCIVTLHEIFLFDGNAMELQCIQSKSGLTLSACTCSDTSLYISTNDLGSIIYEFSLLPTITLVRQSSVGELCKTDEVIQDLVFNKGTLALIIHNHTSHKKHMELRFSQTFENIWSIQFDIVDPLHNVFRLCSLNFNDWLVTDWRTSSIYHVTNDGQIKSTHIFEQVPYRCCQFRSNMLAISTKYTINFHRI